MPDGIFEKVRYEVADGIAEITIDNPPLNLVDRQLTQEYLEAVELSPTTTRTSASSFLQGLARVCPQVLIFV